MPKNAAKSEINNFIGGLVTNASELNYPPNASPDIENFELNKDGSIRRRPGIDFEGSFLLFDPQTLLSQSIATELGVNLRQTSGPVLEKPKDLAAIL